MSGEYWLWIGLAAFLILCCVLPMLFMMRQGRNGRNNMNGRDNSQTKP